MNKNYNNPDPLQPPPRWVYGQQNPETEPINYNSLQFQQPKLLPHQMTGQQLPLNPYPNLQRAPFGVPPANTNHNNDVIPPPPVNVNIGGAWNQMDLKTLKPQGTVARMHEVVNEEFTKMIQNETVQLLQKKMDIVKQGLHDDFNHLDRKFQEALGQQRQKMNVWVRLKVEEIIIKLLSQLRPNLKESLKDPYMCECVKYMIDDIFDEMWPDLEEEILFQVRIKFCEPYCEIVNVKPKLYWFEYPWFYIKSWYLYTTDPFDMSIWQQIRTFSWWFVFLIKLIPFYGIQSFFFCFVFLCTDKRDEYQLVNFILVFKRMQFLSIGVIGTLIGYLTFYSCSTVNALSNQTKFNECKEQGPAIYLNIYVDIIGFLLQVVMIWIAWILLPCSKAKGRPKYRYATSSDVPVDKKSSCCCCLNCHFDRGGKLKCFLLYDLICFLGCIACILALIFAGDQKQLWQIRAAMFLVKTIYGMLSFPFMVFMVPSVTYLLTKSRSTAYDTYGNCVPQVPNLTEYHKEKKMRSSMLHKDAISVNEYDEVYANKPMHEITIIEKEPLMDELVSPTNT